MAGIPYAFLMIAVLPLRFLPSVKRPGFPSPAVD